jgi:two-component system response regulator NreC
VPPRTDLREVTVSRRKIRCLLAHDHVLLRQGLHRLLEDEPDIDVVSEASNAAECLRKLHEFQPDVLLVDAGTFERPALEAELLVVRESPHTRVVFLSIQERGIPAFNGSQAATGNCSARQTSAEEVVEMVRNACGGMAVDRLQESQIPGRHQQTRDSQPRVFSRERALTGREREVLKLLAEGKTVRSAAVVLGLSSKTVDAHKFNLMRKLGIHNKAELVMWAIQRKVVKIPANF